MGDMNGTTTEEKNLQQFEGGSFFAILNQTILKFFGWEKGMPIVVEYNKHTEQVIISKKNTVKQASGEPSSCSSATGV